MSADRLVKQAILKEQNKIMREALEKVAEWEGREFYHPKLGPIFPYGKLITIADEALKKVEEVEKKKETEMSLIAQLKKHDKDIKVCCRE